MCSLSYLVAGFLYRMETLNLVNAIGMSNSRRRLKSKVEKSSLDARYWLIPERHSASKSSTVARPSRSEPDIK